MRWGHALAVVCLVSACGVSLHSGVNPNLGLSSAPPVRRVVVPFAVGFYFAIKDKATIEAQIPATLGALGGKSEPVFGFGTRLLTHSKGWRPGYYGTFAWGKPFANESAGEPAPPDGVMYRFSGGVVWTAYKRDSYGYVWHDWIATTGLGIVFHQQRQQGIGDGAFLGVELTVSVGGSGFAVLDGFTKGPAPKTMSP